MQAITVRNDTPKNFLLEMIQRRANRNSSLKTFPGTLQKFQLSLVRCPLSCETIRRSFVDSFCPSGHSPNFAPYQHYVFSPTTTQTIVKPHNDHRYWKEKRTIFKKELFPRCNRGGLNVKVLQIHSNSDISLRKYFLLSLNASKSQKKFCFSFHSHFLLISTMPLVSFYSTILHIPTNNTQTILYRHQNSRNILNTPYFGIFFPTSKSQFTHPRGKTATPALPPHHQNVIQYYHTLYTALNSSWGLS